jgi:hypothetical protein
MRNQETGKQLKMDDFLKSCPADLPSIPSEILLTTSMAINANLLIISKPVEIPLYCFSYLPYYCLLLSFPTIHWLITHASSEN